MYNQEKRVEEPEWLVISLARTGVFEFVRDMLHAWPGGSPPVWASKHAPSLLPGQVKTITTWRKSAWGLIYMWLGVPCFLYLLTQYLKKNQISTLIFPSFHIWHGWAAWLGRRRGLHTIMIVHDGYPHTGENFPGRVWLENRVFRQASELIFLSQHAKKVFFNRRFTPKKSKVLYHGPLRLTRNPSAVKGNNEVCRLLFLGRIAQYKGLDLLVNALRRLPSELEWNCTLAGEVRGKFVMPNMESLPIKLIKKRISEEQISNLLHSHDILVLPYYEASQSGVLMLAAQAGISTICTKVGGLLEQLPEDACVWISPDLEALVQALYDMISNSNLRHEKARLIKKAGEGLSWVGFFKGLGG